MRPTKLFSHVYTMYFANWFNYDSIMKTFFRYKLDVQHHTLLLMDINICTHRFYAPFQEKVTALIELGSLNKKPC